MSITGMFGPVVNTLAILLGGLFGLVFGRIFPARMKKTVIQGIGLSVLLIGVNMALETKNSLVVIASLVLGGLAGEWINIELRLEQLGTWFERKLSHVRGSGNFSKAFVSTSLIYCVGAMAIMGSLESGLKGNNSILYAKSLLDGISALVFASSMGIGVLAAALPVLVYEGGLTLLAGLLQSILSPDVIAEMSATGGLLILGIGFNILEIKAIKVGNLLPGIFFSIPLTIWFTHLHLGA
ncbi:putative membrane protein YdfK [Peptococcaceae bacterium CEB3]|nr:putative membrane protein YdfK [Peptococcaceae bacterium CEB3]